MIDYKSKELGRTYLRISIFYPSSKLCHCCGYKNTTLTLADREWICPNCHELLDRDNNAAINILNEGLKILSRDTVRSKENDKSFKPVDTGLVTNLEQEPVIACNMITSHAGKSSALAE